MKNTHPPWFLHPLFEQRHVLLSHPIITLYFIFSHTLSYTIRKHPCTNYYGYLGFFPPYLFISCNLNNGSWHEHYKENDTTMHFKVKQKYASFEIQTQYRSWVWMQMLYFTTYQTSTNISLESWVDITCNTDFAMYYFLFKVYLTNYFFNLTHLVRSCKQY